MIHEFLPPNFLESVLHSTYWPKQHLPTEFNRAEWNPWNDPVIDSYILLRFALHREYQARDRESNDLYWRFMSREAEGIAEAERDMFADLLGLVFEAECKYIESTYLDKELESLDVDKLASKLRQRVESDTDIHHQHERVRSRFGITRFMLPPDFLGHQRYNEQLLGQSLDKSEPVVVRPIREVTKQFLRKWTDSTSYLYSEIMMSTRLMHQELIRTGEEKNSLSGPSARSRRLLVNQNIPLPTLTTFLGWYGLVGFRWDKLSKGASIALEKIVGHRPETLITFQVPLLPITREHQGGFGASIAQEDAHSNHSLSARNPAHIRDHYGRILHGYYVVVTAAIGNGAPVSLVTSQIQGADINPRAIAAEHESVIPRSAVEYEGTVITKGLDDNMRFGMLGILSNPWMASPHELRLPYEWAIYGTTGFDTPFRCLSRWHGTMFRMDSIEAIQNWIDAFLNAANQWYTLTPAARSELYFKAVQQDWTRSGPHVVTPKSGKGRFDLSSLGDSDE